VGGLSPICGRGARAGGCGLLTQTGRGERLELIVLCMQHWRAWLREEGIAEEEAWGAMIHT
jgi:hypothetical protein